MDTCAQICDLCVPNIDMKTCEIATEVKVQRGSDEWQVLGTWAGVVEYLCYSTVPRDIDCKVTPRTEAEGRGSLGGRDLSSKLEIFSLLGTRSNDAVHFILSKVKS